MNFLKKIVAGLLLSTLYVSSFSAQGQWSEGYGQGNIEYFIDQEGFRLYIGCPTKEGSEDSQSSVSLIQLSNNKEINNFTIEINGFSYDGPFNTESRVDANNFLSLLGALRKGDAVIKFKNRSIKFPKSNAAKVIPVYGKKFYCNVFF